ncbi:MAG: type II toxin-antitoxin system VapC family toxin [Pyrobaculum sp.]
MYLFDASAVVNILKRGRASALYQGAVLDLTVYEAFNAVWKELYLLRRIDIDTAHSYVKALSRVFDVLPTFTVRGVESEVLKLAGELGVTFYDGSYVYTAASRGLTLVTDDKRLSKAARKKIRVLTSGEFLAALGTF